jgi:hypothetical protein
MVVEDAADALWAPTGEPAPTIMSVTSIAMKRSRAERRFVFAVCTEQPSWS